MEKREKKLAKESRLLKALDELGEGSKLLWIIFTFNFLTLLLFGLNSMSYVFITEIPNHWCSTPELVKANWTTEQIINVTIADPCQKYDYNYSHFVDLGYDKALRYIESSKFKPPIVSCSSFTFDKNGRSTIINEWALICGKRFYRATTYLVFSLGMTLGSGLFGPISDKHGRKISLIISIILQVIAGPASALVQWFWTYMICRFCTGISTGVMYTSAYTILSEVARNNKRKVFAAILDATFSIGTFFVIGMAYFLPNWRHLQLAISCFILPLIILIWFVEESPRWLISQNRHDEAQKIIGKYHKLIVPSTLTEGNQTAECEVSSSAVLEENKGFFNRNFESLRIMFTNPDYRKKILFMYFSYYVTSITSYSLLFNVDNFKSNRYIYLSILASNEVVAHLTASVILMFLSCRKLLILVFIIGFICMMTILAIPVESKIILIILALISKFLFSVGFTSNLVLNSELFPTNVRNAAFGTCVTISQLGSMSAPFVVDVLGDITWWAPTTFCGILALLAGFLCIITSLTKIIEGVECKEDNE